MLNVICERVGTKYRPEAVAILADMISRNLPEGLLWQLHLYTDQPDEMPPQVIVHAWDERKLPGLVLGLDHLIVGSLDDIAARGHLLEEDVCFYWEGPFPQGARVIKCLGDPPQELSGWVKHVWKIGGGTTPDLKFTPNVPKDDLVANIRSASQRSCRWFEPEPAHDGIALIVGGGPSLKDDLAYLEYMANSGEIFALNGVPSYLAGHGVFVDYHVMLDAHIRCLNFVAPEIRMVRYYASQCAPEVLDAAGDSLICWNGGGEAMKAVAEQTGHTFKSVIGGGSTGATRALMLAYGLGYRTFHLFGMDSSYDGSVGHAYYQEDREADLTVTCGDQVFKTSAQMLGQAEDFKLLLPDLIRAACEITVHGDGLLRAVATQMAA